MNNLPKILHDWGRMDYQNTHMKLDQFIAYLNDGKINLIPPFQRGHVWNLEARRKLIQNVVQGRPIPAIFLYREKAGDKYEYNILDGKQRLESLILFIGNERESLKVKNIADFFFGEKLRDTANFKIDIDGDMKGIKDLDDDLFRDLSEYEIPTIQITLGEDQQSGLNEMISLFVDINSSGVPVNRFDIVKAMSKDKLLDSAFKAIAINQRRRSDVFYRSIKNDFTKVLKELQVVSKIREANAKVDRMWELFVEIILFSRSKKHRTPIEILKSFIKAKKDSQPSLTGAERKRLAKVFKFLIEAYKNPRIAGTKMVRNQIHFYTMITSIIADDLITGIPKEILIEKLATFAQIVDGKEKPSKKLAKTIDEYQALSAKHTTHPGRREDRQTKFLTAIAAL